MKSIFKNLVQVGVPDSRCFFVADFLFLRKFGASQVLTLESIWTPFPGDCSWSA